MLDQLRGGFDDQAVAWLRREGGGLGLDTRAIGLWGYSAGAHLASLMSMRAQALPVAGVVAGGTPADLRVWPDSPMVLDLLGQRRDQAPALWAAASPVSQAGTGTPPHFLYHGRLDTLVAYDQAESLRQALLAAGIVVRDQRAAPQLGDALRITLGTPEQNDCVIATLSALKATA